MKNNLRSWLALTLLVVGVFDLDPSKLINIVPPIIKPVLVIEIDQEALAKFIQSTKPITDLVTDKDDRLSIAVFYDELSSRIKNDTYQDAKLQTLNDVIVEAGKIFFVPSLSGKYNGLGSGATRMITEVVGEYDIYLSDQSREDLSGLFKAFAWNLTQ